MKVKLYSFSVCLLDCGGKAGEGTNTRAIVDTRCLLKGASHRIQKQSTAAPSTLPLSYFTKSIPNWPLSNISPRDCGNKVH